MIDGKNSEIYGNDQSCILVVMDLWPGFPERNLSRNLHLSLIFWWSVNCWNKTKVKLKSEELKPVSVRMCRVLSPVATTNLKWKLLFPSLSNDILCWNYASLNETLTTEYIWYGRGWIYKEPLLLQHWELYIYPKSLTFLSESNYLEGI